MSLSALLISGSYKVYASDDMQIYKCTSQSGSIVSQDHVCKKATNVEKLKFTVKHKKNITHLHTHEITMPEKMHQRLHQERALHKIFWPLIK